MCSHSARVHLLPADKPFHAYVHRYEKFTGDKPERAEKSNDPFTDEYTDLVERINGLTLVTVLQLLS